MYFCFYMEALVSLYSLLMSTLSTSTFKAIKSLLAAKLDVSVPVACSNYFFVS